jgi:FkbM family methyltransferase
MMLAKLLVRFYAFVHGTLGLPGAGWLIRRMRAWVPDLNAFPLVIPDVGTAILDFRDEATFGLLNYYLTDYGTDARLLRQLERALFPGAILWDVGANVGYISMYFARSPHRLASIHTFEPNPVPLKTLSSMFRAHPFVRVHPVALGREDGTMEMNISATGSAWSSLVRGGFEGAQKVEIQVRSGDSFQKENNLPLPDLIKIDVEGFEPAVLAGLQQTIRQKRPVIVLEHIWLKDEELKAIVPEGYLLLFIMEDGILTPDFTHRMQGYNAILLPSEKRDLYASDMASGQS